MISYGEKEFYGYQARMLQRAINYLTKLIPQVERDLGPTDINSVHDAAVEQV